MDLFSTLEKHQRSTPFERSSEMHFFLDNAVMLSAYPQFKQFIKASKPFDVMRANIILRSIQNKEIIERAIDKTKKAERNGEEISEDTLGPLLESLPYLRLGKDRVFVPIFPKSVNRLYDGDYQKLYEKPYSSLLRSYGDTMAIDPFDEYGYALYDSYFAKLILIEKNEKEAVFLDYDSFALYCVSSGGRLINTIALFDRYIRRPYHNHLVERVAPVAKAYLEGNRETMIDMLVENELISRKLVFKIFAEERKVFGKMFK